MASEKLIEKMGTDLFVMARLHRPVPGGAAGVKATPTFNIELCDRFKVPPLEFDGRADSLFHPFDAEDRPYMEYIRYHGAFRDVPVESIIGGLLPPPTGACSTAPAAYARAISTPRSRPSASTPPEPSRGLHIARKPPPRRAGARGRAGRERG